MKKWLLFIFIFSVFVIVACSSDEPNLITGATSVKEIIECGNGICDESETCGCIDCENDDRCFEAPEIKEEVVIETCNPGDDNCCGNDVCEESERCNLDTYVTACPEDCSLQCPASLVVGDQRENQIFFCTGDCDFNNENFVIMGDSKIQTTIENIGEKSSNIVTSNFDCFSGDEVFARADGDESYGIEFRDYFNDGEERIDSVNSRITGNNVADYAMEISLVGVEETKNVECTVTLTSTPGLNQVYVLKMKVLSQ